MRTVKIIIAFSLFVALFSNGFLRAVFHHDYVCADTAEKYIGVPEYRFKSKALYEDIMKEIETNRTRQNIGSNYDMCFAECPIFLWNSEQTTILDSSNLLIVSHTPRMSFWRDSIFPHVVRGVVYAREHTFFLYDSITIKRLFQPIDKRWYIRSLDNTSIAGYTVIQGGLEEEFEFYLTSENDLRKIPDSISCQDYKGLSFYFLVNDEFESQIALHPATDIVDTTTIYSFPPFPLFPTNTQRIEEEESRRELDNFILREVRFPLENGETAISPRKVFVNIIVERDGSISSADCLSPHDDYWDNEALRIINLFPPFIPAHRQGVAVKAMKTIMFDFQGIQMRQE